MTAQPIAPVIPSPVRLADTPRVAPAAVRPLPMAGPAAALSVPADVVYIGAMVFYHLTARLSLTPPPGQIIRLGIPDYFSSSQALTSAAVDYADQFASYIPPGSAGPAIVADASGITGRG